MSYGSEIEWLARARVRRFGAPNTAVVARMIHPPLVSRRFIQRSSNLRVPNRIATRMTTLPVRLRVVERIIPSPSALQLQGKLIYLE